MWAALYVDWRPSFSNDLLVCWSPHSGRRKRLSRTQTVKRDIHEGVSAGYMSVTCHTFASRIETCTGCGSLNASNFDWPYKFTVADITRHLCTSPTTCTGLVSRKHSSDCDLATIRGSLYHDSHEPDYAPSVTGHLELQLRARGTVCRPLSLQPAHSRLSKDNWKPFFSRTPFLTLSFILIV